MSSLYHWTKDEWRAVARRVRPDWTDEQFDQAWDDFIAKKAEGRFEDGVN